jgi:hypothetical protein
MAHAHEDQLIAAILIAEFMAAKWPDAPVGGLAISEPPVEV